MKSFVMFIAIIFIGCNPKVKVVKAFYFWQNKPFFDVEELNILDSTQPKIIYIKLFEIKYDNKKGAIPHVINQFTLNSDTLQNSYHNIEFIPTVFIENKVFKNINPNDIDALVDNFINLTKSLYLTKISSAKVLKEIQIDCDWTETTKENYFLFLEKIKLKSNTIISCTLRLYPYKYPNKMGVPPVNSVMLMCYNLIKPRDNDGVNTIFDTNEFEKYIKGVKKYPLKLDIALPTFSWYQHFDNNQFVGFFEILENKSKIKPINNLTYIVEEDFVENNHFFKQGNLLKKEITSTENILNAIELIKKHVPLNKEIRVSLFHLNKNLNQYYSTNEILSFYHCF